MIGAVNDVIIRPIIDIVTVPSIRFIHNHQLASFILHGSIIGERSAYGTLDCHNPFSKYALYDSPPPSPQPV